MDVERTLYGIYGIRVNDHLDRAWLQSLIDEIGPCFNNGKVGFFRGGAYREHMNFLAITCERYTPGLYGYHPGEKPSAPIVERMRWNAALEAAAASHGLKVVERPGWFYILSEY